MKILIDLQGAQTGSRHRGIGRYSMSLTKGILRNAGHHEIIVALSGLLPESIEIIKDELLPYIPRRAIHVWEGVGPTSQIHPENQWRRKASELLRESFIASLDPDIVLVTSLIEGYDDDFAASIHALNKKIPVATIFYDLIPLIYRETYLADPRNALWYEDRLSFLKRSDLFLAISEASMSEGVELLDINPERVVNISAASDDQFYRLDPSQSDVDLLARLNIVKPFLMYTSATDWRKNHPRLIEAFSQLNSNIRRSHQLVFAGRLPKAHRIQFEKFAKEKGLTQGELIITGEVSDAEMNILYNRCKAFVFPSWHEGFGLPVLEAMHCGRAVIGSNRSSIPEVIGNADALFDPFDVDSICKKLNDVLVDESFRKSLERHAKAQAKKFTWDLCAKKSLLAMEEFIFAKEDFVQKDKQPKRESHELIFDLASAIAQIHFPCTDQDVLKAARAISQNHPAGKTKTLFVDISVLVQVDAKTGIQRVVRNILREWLKSAPHGWNVQPIYALPNSPYRYARQFARKFMGEKPDGLVDDVIEYAAGDLFIGLDLLHYNIAVSHENFYQKLRNYGVNVKFVVYDLLPLKFPQYADKGIPEGYLKWLKVVLKSDGAICISQAVANELRDWIKENSQKIPDSFSISWFHLGADSEISLTGNVPADDVDLTLLGKFSQKTTFLSVGTLEPRKGHRQILQAFNQLWKIGFDLNLVFVGKAGWNIQALSSEILKHPEYQKRLFWLNGVSDQLLEEVYKKSACLIAASEGEGFGLPLIEAAQHLKPIIARNLPVFREVAGNHAFYFDGLSPKDLSQAIQEWLALDQKGESPSSNGLDWLTWSQSAVQLARCISND